MRGTVAFSAIRAGLMRGLRSFFIASVGGPLAVVGSFMGSTSAIFGRFCSNPVRIDHF